MMSTMKVDFVNCMPVINETAVDSSWYRSCDSDSDSSSSAESSTSFAWADLDSDDEEMDFSVPLVLGDIDAAVKAKKEKETFPQETTPEVYSPRDFVEEREPMAWAEPAFPETTTMAWVEPTPQPEPVAQRAYSNLNSQAAAFVPRRRAATKVFTNGKPQNGHPEFTIFVKGFSYRVSADDLELFFSPCGYVTKVAAPKDSRGRSRRIAWITFADEASFEAALTMHGQKLTRTLSGKTVDCTLRVSVAQSTR